ncbi:MAG: EutN/CcmL family microcompartment protein [Candidatus Hodarchaeales archaeon]
MKLGKVIGKVVSSIKDPGLDSLRLLVVQGLDDNLEPNGSPYVAVDGILTAGPGDLVYLVSKKEAALVFSKELVPIDECIVGFVEEHFVTKRAKRRVRKKKALPPTMPSKDPQIAKEAKSSKKVESPPPEPMEQLQNNEPTKTTIKADASVTSKLPGKKTQPKKKKLSQDVNRPTKTHSQRRKSQ